MFCSEDEYDAKVPRKVQRFKTSSLFLFQCLSASVTQVVSSVTDSRAEIIRRHQRAGVTVSAFLYSDFCTLLVVLGYGEFESKAATFLRFFYF